MNDPNLTDIIAEISRPACRRGLAARRTCAERTEEAPNKDEPVNSALPWQHVGLKDRAALAGLMRSKLRRLSSER